MTQPLENTSTVQPYYIPLISYHAPSLLHCTLPEQLADQYSSSVRRRLEYSDNLPSMNFQNFNFEHVEGPRKSSPKLVSYILT